MSIRVVVCYESKYGNTERVAETIGEELRNIGGTEVTVTPLKRLDLDSVADWRMILVGGPTHFGGPTRHVTKFIDALCEREVNGKSIAVFDTYLGEDFEKSVKKMEAQIRSRAPALRIVAPGLSIRVADMKGPIVDGELAKCKDFVQRLLPLPIPS